MKIVFQINEDISNHTVSFQNLPFHLECHLALKKFSLDKIQSNKQTSNNQGNSKNRRKNEVHHQFNKQKAKRKHHSDLDAS